MNVTTNDPQPINGRTSPILRAQKKAYDSIAKRFRGPWEDFSRSADYNASHRSEYIPQPKNVHLLGSNADWHMRTPQLYYSAMEVAREIDRNDWLVGQGIDRFCTNVLQHGFVGEADTGNDRADEMINEAWSSWVANEMAMDVQEEWNFRDYEEFVLRHMIVDGDDLTILTRAGQLQLIEGHRIRTPHRVTAMGKPTPTGGNVVLGVSQRSNRSKIGYYVTQRDLNPFESANLQDTRFIPKRSRRTQATVHLRHVKRITQTRGFTKMAPITDAAGLHTDIQFQTALQRQLASMIFMFSHFDQNAMDNDLSFDDTPNDGPCTFDRIFENEHFIRDGLAAIQGRQGEKIDINDSRIPSAEFFPHATMVQQIIALNLDMPLILFLLDAGETNFSGWRGVMEQAKLRFKRFQVRMSDHWHSKVWKWRVDHLLTRQPELTQLASQLGDAIYGHHWAYPRWPYVQPREEAQSNALNVRNALTSRRRVMQDQGADIDLVDAETVRDNANLVRLAKAEAAAINEEFPDDPDRVSWHHLAPISLSEGIQQSVQTMLQEVGDDSDQTEDNDNGGSSDN